MSVKFKKFEENIQKVETAFFSVSKRLENSQNLNYNNLK